MSDHQEQLHEELEQDRVALDQMASEARQLASGARGPSPRAPSTGAPPTDRNIQVIVEIEARSVTVERLFMVSERQQLADSNNRRTLAVLRWHAHDETVRGTTMVVGSDDGRACQRVACQSLGYVWGLWFDAKESEKGRE
jgi:hypothetical protein